MNKSQLTEELAMRQGLSLKDAEAVINTFFKTITHSLIKEKRVEIRGFGSFKTKAYKGFKGRNPKSGQPVQVESKKLPLFKVGKELREMVDYSDEEGI